MCQRVPIMASLLRTAVVLSLLYFLSVSGDSKCRARNGKCQKDSNRCAGRYVSNLCNGGSRRRCCVPNSGRGYVDYRGHRVSDSQVRQKLQQIANLYGKRVWLTSGDRRGTGPSHHYRGRAADFWIDGESSGVNILKRIRASGIMSRNYQVIYHGKNTCTQGFHMHIGRYHYSRATCWVFEGTNSRNRCVYKCM